MSPYASQQSDLGGGGGVNCVAVSPYDDSLYDGGDIQGGNANIDVFPPVWQGGRGGMPDGGEAAVDGGVDYSANSSFPNRLWKANKTGIYVSEDRGLNWVLISGTPSFGTGGGNRPRACGGRVIQSTFNGGVERVYSIDRNGALRRFTVAGDQSDGSSGTLSPALVTLTGTGEAVHEDPTDPTAVYAATRSGLWRVANVSTGSSGTATKFTNITGTVYDVCAVLEGTNSVLFVANGTNGVRRGTDTGAGTSFADKSPYDTNWNVVDAVRQGGVTRLLVTCASNVQGIPGPRLVTSPDRHYEAAFYCDDPHVASPDWVCMCELGKLQNNQGDGTEWWGYLTAAQGGHGGAGNPLVTKSGGPEDARIDRKNVDLMHIGGQNGHWLYNAATDKIRPYMKRLGLTSDWAIIADPNADGTFYCVNQDHTIWGTRDGGDTFRKNEIGAFSAGLPQGTQMHAAGFAVAVESGVSISRVWLGFGHRDDNVIGKVMYHADPMSIPMSAWVKVGNVPNQRRVFGVAARRMDISGTTRVVGIGMIEGGGIMRGVFSTADPPVAIDDWSIVNGTPTVNVGTAGKNYFCSMHFASDDICYGFDGSSGIWISRNKGVTWSRLWGVTNNLAGEAFITLDPDDDPGTVLVSVGSGTNAGLWKLEGCEVGGATVENGQVTRTEIKRGATSFAAAGQVVAHPDGRMWVNESTEPQPRLWYSEDSGATWTNIADDVFRQTAKKVRGIAVDQNGLVAVSMAGPGVLMVRPDGIDPPPPPAGLQVRITRAFVTLDDPSGGVTPEPSIVSFDPVSGVETDPVELVGDDLTDTSSVTINGVEVDALVEVDDEHLTFEVPAGTSTGPIAVTTPGGTALSTEDFTILEDEEPPVLAGVDLPSGSNPEAAITTRVIGIWLIEGDVGTEAAPVTKVKLLGHGPIPTNIGETSEVLYAIGRPRPVRITDAVRGYEGTIEGFIQTRADRRIIEAWKADRVVLRLVSGDLSIPVQIGELSIDRHPTEDGYYGLTMEVEQAGEFVFG